MPSLTAHKESKSIKLLLIGDSGSGKTGALASLAKAGYNIRILDFDNGLDILANLLKSDPEAEKRVTFQTLTDKLKAVNGIMLPSGVPTAFTRAMNLLTNWKTPEEDLGNVATWDQNTVLVIDSLTFMSEAAFRLSEVTGNYKDPRQTYGEAQDRVESCLGYLYSDEVKCHVIVNSHIAYIEAAPNITKGYPSSVGKALSPTIPRYFNTVLQSRLVGVGTNAKRVIASVPNGIIDLKTPLPVGDLPAELPIETGLATFFEKLRGGKPQ